MNKILQVMAEAYRFGNIIYHNRLETPQRNIERDSQYYKNRTQYVNKLGEAQNLLARIKGFQHFHELNENLIALENTQTKININLKENLLIAKNAIKTIPFVARHFEPIVKDKSFSNIEQTIPTSFFQRKQKIERKYQKDLLIGDIGSGIEYIIYYEALEDIKNNEPVIYISGTGSNTYIIKLLANLSDKQNKDTYILNFLFSKETQSTTDSINPMDLWLLSKQSFEQVFPASICSWLYPALISLKEKGQQLSLDSLIDIISLSTIISMAQTNEFNNKLQAQEYLQKLGLNINKFDDENLEQSLNKHIYELGNSIDTLSVIKQFISTGQFCDVPTINLMHIFAKRKNLLISLPHLDMAPHKYQRLSHLINTLILGADELNSKNYCQNIYGVDNYMRLTDKQKNSPNKIVAGYYTPYEFTSNDLTGFERIIIRKVFKVPTAIEDAIFNNYFSSDYPEALDYISHKGTINVFDSNKNRTQGKYSVLTGFISFSISKNEPAHYFNFSHKYNEPADKNTYIKVTKHIGGTYE